MIDRIFTFGRMIKFSHSIFALPFALSGAALAGMHHPITSNTLVWIVLAMVGARSAAMGFNRLVDRQMDAANLRTSNREIPSGKISPVAVTLFVIISSCVLIFAAYQLNFLCFALSPVALAIVFFYSFTKRFTWGTQFFLGLALAVSPVGAWIAVSGSFNLEIFLLGGAVLAWVAGFDVLYACQDVDFDREFGVYSIPARFGIQRALVIAKLFHVLSFVLMLCVGFAFSLGSLYFGGIILIGGLFIYEHRLIRADDLSRMGVAFQNMNAFVSVAYLLFTVGDILIDL